MITESAAYAVLSVVKSTMTYLYESGLWVGRRKITLLKTVKGFCCLMQEIKNGIDRTHLK